MNALARAVFATLPMLFLPLITMAAEMRLEGGPLRVTGIEGRPAVGFPNTYASSTGQLRIGQTYSEVRALLQEQNSATRFTVEKRRFQLRNMRTEASVVALQATAVAPDRSFVETLRLRFTSQATGQRLYFIHREVEFRRMPQARMNDFLAQIATRFQGSTWSMTVPGHQSYRQIFADGRMLSWAEAQLRPELGGCFLLSGGPSFEQALDESSLTAEHGADVAHCGGGIDVDWRGDIRRFTVTLIDFPLYRDDRQALRRNLESALRRVSGPPSETRP